MKKIFKILLVLVLIGIIGAFLVWKFYVNKPHADIEKATPAFSLETANLWQSYNDNLHIADSLYTGKVIELSGKLSKSEITDTSAILVFVMEADSMFGDKSFRCEMLPKYIEAAKAATQGSDIKIKGLCNGFDQTDVKFAKCSILK